MNIELTPLLKFLSISVAIIIFDACSCKTCGVNSQVIEAPDSVFEQVDNFIIDRVGKEFFEQHIHADYLGSKKNTDGYEVRYNFKMLQYDFVDEEILIVTDPTGKILDDVKPKGIPACAIEESGCEFTVDKERAIEIGVANNLPEGIKEWAVEFRWSEVAGRYIWHVITTTHETGEGENYKASGEEVMINPVNADLLKKREWNIF